MSNNHPNMNNLGLARPGTLGFVAAAPLIIIGLNYFIPLSLMDGHYGYYLFPIPLPTAEKPGDLELAAEKYYLRFKGKYVVVDFVAHTGVLVLREATPAT